MNEQMRARYIISTNGRGLSRAIKMDDGSWEVDFPIEGKDIRCLAVDPLNPGVVYAGGQEGGVLRSDDIGKSWRSAGLEGTTVKSISVSKVEAGHVYAGTKSPASIFHSKDGGKTWQEIEGFSKARRWYWFSPAEPPFSAYVQSVALSPTDPKVMAVGIEFGAVVRSDDGGQTWSGHLDGTLRDCHMMVFHESDGDWVYEAGGSGGGAAVSSDGGAHWRQEKQDLDRSYGWGCVGDGIDPETWYVSSSFQSKFPNFVPPAHVDGQANAAIYRKRRGESWTRLAGGLPDPLNYMAYALKSDPQEGGHLYTGLSSGDVWFTSDYGESWEQLSFNLKGIYREMIVLF